VTDVLFMFMILSYQANIKINVKIITDK